ncbi:MAG: ATP-binding cassette domain-containing protein [Trueperaceae bacterium]|nr:MAG: ATP-binding cassette domain-containing protein [Trueperaceae bacterium]
MLSMALIEVVRDLSARLRPGEFACLIGINCAGTCTLLRTLAALQPALAGRVLMEGTPVRELAGRGAVGCASRSGRSFKPEGQPPRRTDCQHRRRPTRGAG